MPIIQAEDHVLLAFGTGDIEMGAVLLGDKEIRGVVVFFPNEGDREIGFTNDYVRPRKLKYCETPVRMTFTKVESIDAIIRGLEATKEEMLSAGLHQEEFE